jgi:Mce-associated membrane protein
MTEVMRSNGSRPDLGADLELDFEETGHLNGAVYEDRTNGHAPGFKAPKAHKAQKAKPKSDKPVANGHGAATGLWAQIAEEVTSSPSDEVATPKKQAKTSAKKSSAAKKSQTTQKSSPSPTVEAPDDFEVVDQFVDPVEEHIDGVNEPSEEHEAAETSWRTKRATIGKIGFTYTTLIVSVIAVALAVALILTTISLSNKNSLEGERASALSSARTYAAEMAGYTYQNLSHDFGVVESNSTPSFKHSFLLSSSALKSTLVKYHASAAANVVSAGIVSSTATTATILLLVDQTVKNTVEKNTTTDRNQLLMTMSYVKGKWLISNVTEL